MGYSLECIFISKRHSIVKCSKSLIQNNGFDGSGTNCGGRKSFNASNLYMKELPLVPITPVVENLQARQAYVNYYARTNSFMAKASGVSNEL